MSAFGFHVFLSYDGKRYGVCDTWAGGRRYNSTHKNREYTQEEAQALADWMDDKVIGYASLERFEGGANWPQGDELSSWS